MRLIINSNPLFSAFIKDSSSRKLIFHPSLELFTPDYTLEEIQKYEELICQKSNSSPQEFQLLLLLFFERIILVPVEQYSNQLQDASDRLSDQDDAPFLALALSMANDGIWSNDAGFRTQHQVKVWSTEELAQLFLTTF